MKQRIICTVLWALAFPAAHFLASIFAFAIMGFIGMPKEPPTGFMLMAFIWAWSFWLSPLLAVALSFFGVLPGTKRKDSLQRAA